MEFPERMQLRRPIFLQEGDEKLPLPDWSKALVWFGWWCRQYQMDGRRILAVVILPARRYASVFVGLGCLLAGATQFRGGFSWDDLQSLPPGTEIFWKTASHGVRYQGTILEGNDGIPGLVRVLITSTRRSSEVGSVWYFSPAKFAECLFSEECLPAEKGTAAIDNALRFHRDLGLETDPKWIWTAGAEGLIVTNQAGFREAVKGLNIAVGTQAPLPLGDVLCAAGIHDKNIAKLRLASSGRVSERIHAPLTVLDGAAAWDQMSHVHTGNVVVLLERTEYTADVHNVLLEAAAYADEPPADIRLDIPGRLPPGVEASTFFLSER